MVKSPATKSLDPMSGGVSGSIPWNMDFDLSSPDTLLIRLSGNWKIANRLPAANEVAKQLSPGARIKKSQLRCNRAWRLGQRSHHLSAQGV